MMLQLWKGMKGEIVQRLEHWNHNPNVVGSIPSFASFIKKITIIITSFDRLKAILKTYRM